MSGGRSQPARFVLVGTVGFVLNGLAFSLLFHLGVWYVVASLVAYLASNAAMYVGNRYFTFGLSHNGLLAAYARYLVVGCVVAVLTTLLLAAFVEGIGLDPRFGQALALSALLPLSFLLSKRCAFRLSLDTP